MSTCRLNIYDRIELPSLNLSCSLNNNDDRSHWYSSDDAITELSTGRMDPGSGRVGSGHDFAGFWRVGSGQHFGFFSFLLIISWYLNRCESSNTILELIDFLRYLI